MSDPEDKIKETLDSLVGLPNNDKPPDMSGDVNEMTKGPNDRCEPLANNENENVLLGEKVDDDDHDKQGSNVNNAGVINGRRRCRRNKKGGRRHKKWKPYEKLTWDERKVLEEKETKRACQRRERRFASGQPMAPYNTTQFIMDQNENGFELTEEAMRPRSNTLSSSKADIPAALGSDSGSENGFYSSPSDEEDFLAKEFTDTYESVHQDRLSTMNKEELVREVMTLEKRVERLERRLSGGNDTESSKDDRNESPVSAPEVMEVGKDSVGADAGTVPFSIPAEQRVSVAGETFSMSDVIKLQRENARLQREVYALKHKGYASS